jgi:hypothetical protein
MKKFLGYILTIFHDRYYCNCDDCIRYRVNNDEN